MDISPINRDVIYRTRSAGSNISQYIGSTRETWILIILVHSVAACNLQHITLIYSALQFIPQQRSWERKFTWTNLQHHLLLLHAVELQFLCSALPISIFAFIIIICGPLWLTYLLPQVFDVLKYNSHISGLALYISLWNISAIYRKWLYIYLCEIYRQYIGTDCTRSALARQMKF